MTAIAILYDSKYAEHTETYLRSYTTIVGMYEVQKDLQSTPTDYYLQKFYLRGTTYSCITIVLLYEDNQSYLH